jgi:hypothetical protein
MTDVLGAPLTAATAIIQFMGQRVGELQSVGWTENSNYRRVSGIGNPIDSIHVPGIAQYEITARRAFLESDLVVDLVSGLKTTNGQVDGITPFGGIMSNATSANSMTADNLRNALTTGAGNLDLGDKISALYFEILINNAVGAIVYKFMDCSMNTRRASIDVNGIIIMSDITILARKKHIATDSTRAQEIKL